ncbi:MAG TPA: GspH/FimT family protein [Ideonella sp.]|nr:GspH/FimT family protein [Ideonella sp.]
MGSKHRQAGLTLVEAVAAMAVAAVLAGAAVPSFKQMNARRQVEAPSVELATDLLYARSEAIARNESVRVSFFAPAAGACYVLHTGDAGDCSCSGSAPASCTNGAREIKTVLIPAGRGVTLQSNVASMLFHPVRGTTTPAGTVKVQGSGYAIHHVVNIMGRVRSCTPAGAMPGYKPC